MFQEGESGLLSNSAKRSSKQGQLATVCKKMEVIGIRRCHWVKEKKPEDEKAESKYTHF